MSIQGNLQDTNLPTLLQFVSQSEDLACLQFQQGQTKAILFVAGRSLCHAEMVSHNEQGSTHLQGEEVFYELLAWKDGSFAVKRNASLPQNTIEMSWEFLLMEGLRRMDEAQMATRNDEDDQEESLLERLSDLSEDDAVAIKEMMALQENNDMASKSEQLHEILNDVVNSSSDIIGAAAVDNDGLLMASNFNSSIDSNRIAAVTAGLISLATRSAQQLSQGAVKQTLIQAEKGNIIAIRANPQISLVILTSVDINLGLAFMRCRDAAQAIGNML